MKKIIEKIKKAGIKTKHVQFNKISIEVAIPEQGYDFDMIDSEKSYDLAEEIRKIINWSEMYKSGFGSWVITK